MKVANDISEFVDESHRHHAHSQSDVQLDPLLAGWVADAYGALRDLEAGRNSGNARQILDQISAEFGASLPMLATLAGVKTEAVNVLAAKDAEIASNIEAREYAEARLAQGEVELAQTQEKFKLVQQEVEYTHNAYRNSHSWKMTAPLRLLRVAVSKPLARMNPYLSRMRSRLSLMWWRFYKR